MSAAVRPAVLQTAPPFAANNDVVDLGLPLTRRRQTSGGVPATVTSEACTSEEQLMVSAQG